MEVGDRRIELEHVVPEHCLIIPILSLHSTSYSVLKRYQVQDSKFQFELALRRPK
jgi:hypothetical protein